MRAQDWGEISTHGNETKGIVQLQRSAGLETSGQFQTYRELVQLEKDYQETE